MIKGCSWTVYGPAATSISRTVLRITGQLVLDKIPLEASVPLQLALTARQLLRRREGVSILSDIAPSSSLCSCWTCRTGDGPPATLLWPWSSATFTPSRLRLSLPVSCPRRGVWTWLRSSSTHSSRDLGLRHQCVLDLICSQLLQPALTDFGPTTPGLFTRPGLFRKSSQLKLASWSQFTVRRGPIRRPTGFIFSPRAFPFRRINFGNADYLLCAR